MVPADHESRTLADREPDLGGSPSTFFGREMLFSGMRLIRGGKAMISGQRKDVVAKQATLEAS
jgi:hypothetical protein